MAPRCHMTMQSAQALLALVCPLHTLFSHCRWVCRCPTRCVQQARFMPVLRAFAFVSDLRHASNCMMLDSCHAAIGPMLWHNRILQGGPRLGVDPVVTRTRSPRWHQSTDCGLACVAHSRACPNSQLLTVRRPYYHHGPSQVCSRAATGVMDAGRGPGCSRLLNSMTDGIWHR
jgi:hypothetical protein